MDNDAIVTFEIAQSIANLSKAIQNNIDLLDKVNNYEWQGVKPEGLIAMLEKIVDATKKGLE